MMTSKEISKILIDLHVEDSSGNKSKFATKEHATMWRDILGSTSEVIHKAAGPNLEAAAKPFEFYFN